MREILEFTNDFVDNIPKLSYKQILMILFIIGLIVIIEYVCYYNTILYGAISFPGFAPTPAPAAVAATGPTKKKKQK